MTSCRRLFAILTCVSLQCLTLFSDYSLICPCLLVYAIKDSELNEDYVKPARPRSKQSVKSGVDSLTAFKAAKTATKDSSKAVSKPSKKTAEIGQFSYQDCSNEDVFDAYDLFEEDIAYGKDLKTSKFTSRGLDQFIQYTPEFVHQLLTNKNVMNVEGFKIVEVGCGNGHLLSKLQHSNPKASTYCTNYKAYGNLQAENIKDYLKYTLGQHVKVKCKVDNSNPSSIKPVVPKIYLQSKGVAEDDIPLKYNTVDLVISQFTYDKVAPGETAVALSRVFKALRIGGVAVIYPPYVTSYYYYLDKEHDFESFHTRSDHLIKTVNFNHNSTHQFSVLIYIIKEVNRRSHFGFAAKRCEPGFFMSEADTDVSKWGCFSSPTKNDILTATEQVLESYTVENFNSKFDILMYAARTNKKMDKTIFDRKHKHDHFSKDNFELHFHLMHDFAVWLYDKKLYI